MIRHIPLLIIAALWLSPPSAATLTVNGKAFYINGINAPWNQFGTDAGSHYQWGHLYNSSWFEQLFTQCEQYGVNTVRLWIHCDGRSSPEFDDNGYVTGLDQSFIADFRDILVRALKHNCMVMPCLWSFDMTKNTTTTAGRYAGNHSDLITDSAKTQSYIDKALIPIIREFAATPNLLAWEIINEPEWSIGDIDAGGAVQVVTKVQMQRFCGMIASAIHANTSTMVTVGSAAFKWCSERVPPAVVNIWSDAALKAVCNNDPEAYLDFYQVHYYDWMYNAEWGYDPFQLTPAKTPAYWELDKPVLIGESPAKDGKYTVAQMVANCYANGYCGIMPWSYAANDGMGDWNSIREHLKSFRDAHREIVDFSPTQVIAQPQAGTYIYRPAEHRLFTEMTGWSFQSRENTYSILGRKLPRGSASIAPHNR